MLAIFLTLALILQAFPLAAFGSEAEIAEGTYEGEYDGNGKRSGFGTWAYYNFLYVGNWENDLPNGEGTLYLREAHMDKIVHGNWVDGYAEGTVECAYTEKNPPGVFIWRLM